MLFSKVLKKWRFVDVLSNDNSGEKIHIFSSPGRKYIFSHLSCHFVERPNVDVHFFFNACELTKTFIHIVQRDKSCHLGKQFTIISV